jgi:hypothetical protein
VISVDGEKITSMSRLKRLAEKAANERRELRLVLRSVTDDGRSEELFYLRDLPVDTIEAYPP